VAGIQLLTAEEIADYRRTLEQVIQVSEWEWRVLVTLEALQDLAHTRLEALLAAEAERDEARRLACDYFSDCLHLDEDPEDMERIIYHSGLPEWLRPIERFFELNPHVRRK
jgi:hypothetical protein